MLPMAFLDPWALFRTNLGGGPNQFSNESIGPKSAAESRVPSRIHAGQMIAEKKCSVPLVVRPENVLCPTCFWNTKADKMA
jgi:hypothetical protein